MLLNIYCYFTIAKKKKQPKYPPMDEWVMKIWHIYTMEYYLFVKKKGIMKFFKQLDLENIILSDVNQTQKEKCLLSLMSVPNFKSSAAGI